MNRFFFFSILFCSILNANPIIKKHFSYYDIYPINKHKLEDSMDETSPIYNNGNVRHGTVNWKIKYFYKTVRKNGICSIAEAKTKVDITYYVPKLASNYTLPDGTRTVFQRYYNILKNYLDKHTSFALDAALEIEEQLPKVEKVSNDCNIVKQNAKNLAKSILKKYKKKNKDFEIRTYEGFLEGVRKENLL
ncbi:DUF922 domain-containing protein [Arcobacter arenosus]|jgi:predicted secreted Zn-dependent protease|uniref:DUF922 domain-containing protein n=1 Tax=Arcobacter arenosus TaxID=2576037 RepID=A0A5R8XYA5_9BACT|nr:DUF922 domain-containing protein [Arcobacter arenosus]TLP36310.1 DUF922 domain-containing protein [Arcobacter arenosus]